MATIWLDGTKMYISAGSIKEERLLREAEKRGYINKSSGVDIQGLDIIWETKHGEKKRGENILNKILKRKRRHKI